MALRISTSPITASLKHQHQNRKKTYPDASSSPLRSAEEFASRLGFELAAADLERLFRWTPPPPSAAGGIPLRVAYQGSRGSYSQEAAAAAFPSSAGAAFPCHHMEAAFAALEDLSADRAVVPLENSLDGPIGRNLDLLLRHPAVVISGELLLPVNHCLLALPSSHPSSLRRVVSHPQALAHCRRRLAALDIAVEEVPCAADAARIVAEEGIADTAVIGSRMAAREFGLRVLEENLQDQAENVNRFLQLALGPTPPPITGREKTTLALSLLNGPSDLFLAMRILESRGVKVTRVDHRPNRSNPVRVVVEEDKEDKGIRQERVYMDYVYILDVEGNRSDVESALARLEEISGSLRVLGSYKCTYKL
ncbi:arogenate dehydratase 3-like [Typha latifolia]|uniref:arogenate dehydratase 3-like n=1 Tax=Typha latifolia TaxID=4733 RepID=UPI003C2D4C49